MLSAIFAVLFLLTVSKNKAPRHTITDIAEQSGLEEPLGDEFLVSRVARLEIFAGARPDRKIVCDLEGGEWRLASHGNAPAERKKVERFLTALKHLQGQLRMAGPAALQDFYLAEEPEASLLRPEDFVDRYFPGFLDRLKNGGQRLGSVGPCELRDGPVPGAVRDFLIAKGYQVPSSAVSAAGEGRWQVAHYYLVADKAGADIYLADPLSEYLSENLSACAREFLQNYDSRTFPYQFARFVLDRANGRDAVAQYLQEELNRLSLSAKDDVTEHLRRYANSGEAPEGSRRAASVISTQLIKRALAADFNRLLEREIIYDRHRFAETPGKEILEMLADPKGRQACVNRLLLESAYPREIAPSRRPIHVRVYSGKNPDRPSYYLLIGKRATAEEGEAKATCFVRARAAGKVYEVREDLRALLTVYGDEEPLAGLPVFPWLARVVEVDRQRICRIALTYPDKKLVFTKEADGGWRAEPARKLKPDAMEFLLGQIASLEAMDALDPKVADKLGLKWDFALEMSTGEEKYTVTGSLPSPGENGYCLRPDRPGIIYRIWSGKFSGIFPKDTDLFE